MLRTLILLSCLLAPELKETRRRMDTQTEDRRFAFDWPTAGVGCPPPEPPPAAAQP